MSRQIQGLQWARTISRPQSIRSTKVRGTRLLGLAYEARVAQALRGAINGQWFEFLDSNGYGVCQTDHLVVHEGTLWVLETKLTDIFQGKLQLQELYLPVVAAALGATPRGAVVVRHLIRANTLDTIVGNLHEAQAVPGVPVIHWLGTTPLSTLWPLSAGGPAKPPCKKRKNKRHSATPVHRR